MEYHLLIYYLCRLTIKFFTRRKAMGDRSLKTLGVRLTRADKLLVKVLGHRMELVRQVGAHKARNGQKIIRVEIERQRLIKARAWARKNGLRPDFVSAILYLIIAESCRLQIDQLQGGKSKRRPKG